MMGKQKYNLLWRRVTNAKHPKLIGLLHSTFTMQSLQEHSCYQSNEVTIKSLFVKTEDF